VNLTNSLELALEAKMDPASPQYSNRQFSTSLLREGAVLTLENPKLKEQIFPLLLHGANSSATVAQIIQINQILETPGATAEWQDDGGIVSPTYFSLASGQLDVNYNYRESAQYWISVTLRLFSQPYGTAAQYRPFAAASAVGPVLLVTPYNTFQYNPAVGLTATTQNGVAGWGNTTGASSGVFYPGNPSLAGDAPAMLRVTYGAPKAPNAAGTGYTPYAAVSWLPDGNYLPQLAFGLQVNINTTVIHSADSVASTYYTTQMPAGAAGSSVVAQFSVNTPVNRSPPAFPPVTWVGNHRLFAIARASQSGPGQMTAQLGLMTNALVPFTVPAVVSNFDWQLLDLGTYTLRASEPPDGQLFVTCVASSTASANVSVDVTAFMSLPDNSTWFINPTGIQSAQYGYASNGVFAGAAEVFPIAPYSNTIFIDDTLPDQFLAWTNTNGAIASGALFGASSGRITQYSRGIVPRPDPSRGLPVLAMIGVGQPYRPLELASSSFMATASIVGASWANPQNRQSMCQIDVLERVRYTFD
jgi:hypothetical protein